MILRVEGVTKRFGGLVAVNNVSFTVNEGEILGIIGPNGAGKTTLFNLISGVYIPDEGEIYFRDIRITKFPSYERAKIGLARTHQIVRPMNELTVLENVMVGACFGKADLSYKDSVSVAMDVLKLLRLDGKADLLAGQLNLPEKKRLEIARALASMPDILLLDEVLAGLNPKEVDEMLDVIRKIKDEGITILMIEHLMHAVMSVSDRIVVLDFGVKIAEGKPKEVASDPRVIEAYLGDPEIALKFVKEVKS